MEANASSDKKLIESVSEQVKVSSEKREKEAESEKESMYPIPTLSNPLAVYVDEEARSAALAKSAAKITAEAVPQDPRKRRLMELRKRMAAGRNSNKKEVMLEHKRLSNPNF